MEEWRNAPRHWIVMRYKHHQRFFNTGHGTWKLDPLLLCGCGVTFSGSFVFIRRCFNSISSPLISLGGNWKVLHIRLYCSQKKLFHNSHSLSILNTTIRTMTKKWDVPSLTNKKLRKKILPNETLLSLRGHFHRNRWLDKIEAVKPVYEIERDLTTRLFKRTADVKQNVFLSCLYLRQFCFSEWLYPAQTARLSSFTASDDRGLRLYDPNGKQLGGEYLNILPKIY